MTSIARNGITTTNAEGAKTFYGDLFGWEFMDDEIPGGIYTMRHGDVATRHGFSLR